MKYKTTIPKLQSNDKLFPFISNIRSLFLLFLKIGGYVKIKNNYSDSLEKKK